MHGTMNEGFAWFADNNIYDKHCLYKHAEGVCLHNLSQLSLTSYCHVMKLAFCRSGNYYFTKNSSR